MIQTSEILDIHNAFLSLYPFSFPFSQSLTKGEGLKGPWSAGERWMFGETRTGSLDPSRKGWETLNPQIKPPNLNPQERNSNRCLQD